MIYVTGDLHGEEKVAHEYSKVAKAGDLVIVAGDFGVPWYADKTAKYADIDERVLSYFREAEFTVAFIDGNHENFDLLATYPIEEKWGGNVQNVEGSYHLMRGELYTMDDGSTIFTFGGGTSVDKAHRTEGVSWWPQEICSYEEIQHAYETLDACNWTVDYVITHTAPRQFKRLYAGTDFRKDKTGCKTADFLTSICDDLTYKQWYFGHYHYDVADCELKARLLFDKIVPLGK
jgi:hypothetical protein